MRTAKNQHIIPVDDGWCIREFRVGKSKIIRDKDEAIRKAAYRAEIYNSKMFLHFKNGKVEEVDLSWALRRSGIEYLVNRSKGKDTLRRKNNLIRIRCLRPAGKAP
ncbi:MAG TPA: hypothetical protein PKC91_12060 [Ignavibacteria bacterium]|nr:hypothetical protein [Ignavibacteria bacterium]